MEIPLVLRERPNGRLVYAVPALFRASMALSLALLAGALFVAGGTPGPGGWIALGVLALAGLYEERWTFDAPAAKAVRRSGLLFLARRTELPYGEIARFRIAPFVRGTVPGSADEASENAAALAGGRADDGKLRPASHKRPYLCLVCETESGARYFIDARPARRAEALKGKASRIAEACGKELVVA